MTDQVFDGRRGHYVESDRPSPINAYGRTKAEAERTVSGAGPSATVLRLGLVFGWSPQGTRSCLEQVVHALGRGERPRLFTDEFRTPVSAGDVASAVAELLPRTDVPLLHLGGPQRLSRYDFGVLVARAFGFDPARLVPVRQADLELGTRRPADVSLDCRLARSVLRDPPRGLHEELEALVSSGDGHAFSLRA